ncbi:substrate-binding domain-containing protein [Caenimonas soli]|uniref:substrate-binding domain-containing protein n=1 Tax=Caenimonas soli TaxID=2735555 RepID=UPI0015525DB0|nr:substrate-binding domain-containing protein [Caenimonas soli]NPC59139.1 solute-binding protein [Caenimonas soli]
MATDSAIDQLGEAGIVSRTARKPLVATEVAVAVKAGHPRPDIRTVERLVAALRQARSVAYTTTGASGIHFIRLMGQLGIADEVNAKATILDGGLVAEALLDDRADLAVQQRSELLTVPGVDVIGAFPEAVACRTDFTVAAFAMSAGLPHVCAALAFLVSEVARDAYSAYGLTARSAAVAQTKTAA